MMATTDVRTWFVSRSQKIHLPCDCFTQCLAGTMVTPLNAAAVGRSVPVRT